MAVEQRRAVVDAVAAEAIVGAAEVVGAAAGRGAAAAAGLADLEVDALLLAVGDTAGVLGVGAVGVQVAAAGGDGGKLVHGLVPVLEGLVEDGTVG